MTKPLAYLNNFRDRYGVRRYYFRRFGKRVALPGKPGDPEFQRTYSKALKDSTAGVVKKEAYDPRSIAALVMAYRSTPHFLSCKLTTQNSYNQALKEIETSWGKYAVSRLTRTKVNELMANRAGQPKRANRLHKRLKAIMELGVDMGWIEVNPVGSRRPFKVQIDGFPEWPEGEIKKFHQYWPRGTKERVGFDLILYLGQRSIDTVPMHRNHIEKGRIRVIQEKTGAVLWIKLHSELRATLDAGPTGDLLLMETAYSQQRTVKGFYNWLKAAMVKAGMDKSLSPHGGRKAAATRLCDVGCSAAQICAITGHASIQEMERYIKARNQVKLADSAIELLEKKGRNE